MNEDKSTRYHRLGRRAGILSTLWTGIILVALVSSGASLVLREWAASMAPANPAVVVAVYVLVLAVFFDAAALPFSVYRGFLLERRYGLSTETMAHWLKDHAKAVLIGVVFAELGAAFVYFALRRWPAEWWAIAGVGYSGAAIALVNLAPVILLPLFFTFKPLEKATLRDRLTALASKAGTRIMGVYEWTLSDRTKKANAALTGMGSTRRILLSDTLLAEYSDDEIEVILAHELAHHVHKDIWTSILFDIGLTFVVFFAADLALGWAAPLFGLHGTADPAGLPILLLTAGAIGVCVKPLLNAVSRSHERRADSYALKLTENPSAFITAMKRLGQQNLAEDSPSRLVQAFFYTHPPDQGAAASGGILGAIRRASPPAYCLSPVLSLPDHQLPDHLPAPVVGRQVAVDREPAGLIGAELENNRLSGLDALRNAVFINGEAVRNVPGRERDAHQIVLPNLEACGTEGVFVGGHRECALAAFLRAHHQQCECRSHEYKRRPAPACAQSATARSRRSSREGGQRRRHDVSPCWGLGDGIARLEDWRSRDG